MSYYNVTVFSRNPNDLQALMLPYRELVEAQSPYAVFKENPDCDVDETTGRRGYWYNPKARWDWYEVGGAWARTLRLLPGRKGKCGEPDANDTKEPYAEGKCDRAWAQDCDFSPDESEYEKGIRFWELVVERAEPKDEEEKEILELYKPEYCTRKYGSKEDFANFVALNPPFAFITADGEWFEEGKVGWFGSDNGTRESREAYTEAYLKYLETVKAENLYVTIVDCHI